MARCRPIAAEDKELMGSNADISRAFEWYCFATVTDDIGVNPVSAFIDGSSDILLLCAFCSFVVFAGFHFTVHEVTGCTFLFCSI